MKVDGVKIIEPDVHTDYRGDLWTLWKSGDFGLDFNSRASLDVIISSLSISKLGRDLGLAPVAIIILLAVYTSLATSTLEEDCN